jgi:hypothetical protein
MAPRHHRGALSGAADCGVIWEIISRGAKNKHSPKLQIVILAGTGVRYLFPVEIMVKVE